MEQSARLARKLKICAGYLLNFYATNCKLYLSESAYTM